MSESQNCGYEKIIKPTKFSEKTNIPYPLIPTYSFRMCDLNNSFDSTDQKYLKHFSN